MKDKVLTNQKETDRAIKAAINQFKKPDKNPIVNNLSSIFLKDTTNPIIKLATRKVHQGHDVIN